MTEEVKEGTSEEQPKDDIERAKETANFLKEQNEIFKKNLEEYKKIETRRILGGETLQGKPEEKPKEETAREYMNRVMTGGLNDKPKETAD